MLSCQFLVRSLRANVFLAYGGNCEPKEDRGEDNDWVNTPVLRILVPLDITCGNEEGKKDTCTVNPGSAQERVWL